MEKQNPYDEKMVQIFGRRVHDQNALTIVELAESTGLSKSHLATKVKEKISRGEIEQVWKHRGGRAVPAFRPTRGKK
jgi:DNA-binding transcriptional regulator GbsR (MarR family)